MNLSTNSTDWFFFALVLGIIFLSLSPPYLYWKRNQYTREYFAFFGFVGITGLVGIYILALQGNASLAQMLLSALLKPFGIEIKLTDASLSPLEAVLTALLLAGVFYLFYKVFLNWNGCKSLAQHKQAQSGSTPNLLMDSALLLSRRTDKAEQLQAYNAEPEAQKRLDIPETLAWHERAKDLWLLNNRTYLFEDYDPAKHCWLGEEKNTGALVLLVCQNDAPNTIELNTLKNYARQVASQRNTPHIEIISASAQPCRKKSRQDDTIQLCYTDQDKLLEKLVDFTDYFTDLNYRVERQTLVDSPFTLADCYTPSFYSTEKKGKRSQQSLESYIKDWLALSTRRQLAVLGEYGQGKSTSSLLLSYHLAQDIQAGKKARIPILIELRGRTLRTLAVDELLALWAKTYRIDPQALLHLHYAGRLLLIFEGFDEIDLSGDTESRLAHFNSLWQANTEEAKIIITGRPNFFLDSYELRRALGDELHTQTLYLAPFHSKQIKDSLRPFPEKTQIQIIAMAEKQPNFLEVVARPSLLYNVAVLWRKEKLFKRNDINSALVIDLFIKHTLARQQAKQNKRRFMVLNSAERRYFMAGVAAYMAVHELPNQISKQQLQEVVRRLTTIMPEAVSCNVSCEEKALPLCSQKRLNWKEKRLEIIDSIETDVRSCGLLVNDLSKDGSFKFAHKSYMELLQAQVISDIFSENITNKVSGNSLKNSWNFKLNHLYNSGDSMKLFIELVKINLQKKNNNRKSLATSLWNILVLGQLSISFQWKNIFISTGIWFSTKISAWLISLFHVDNRKDIAKYLLINIYSHIISFIISIAMIFYEFSLINVVKITSTLSASIGVLVGVIAFINIKTFAFALAISSIVIGIMLGSVIGALIAIFSYFIMTKASIFFIFYLIVTLFSTIKYNVYIVTINTLSLSVFVSLLLICNLISGCGANYMIVIVFSSILGVLLGVIFGLMIDFLYGQSKNNYIVKNISLWHKACEDFDLYRYARTRIDYSMAQLLKDNNKIT